MKRILSVRDRAERDLKEARDYYERQRPGLGRRFHNDVAETIRRIETHPGMYPPAELPRYRRAVLNVFPFCVYYRVTDTKILIVAVYDSRRGTPWYHGRKL